MRFEQQQFGQLVRLDSDADTDRENEAIVLNNLDDVRAPSTSKTIARVMQPRISVSASASPSLTIGIQRQLKHESHSKLDTSSSGSAGYA